MSTQDRKISIRPRFREEVGLSPSDIKQKIQMALDSSREICLGKMVDNHVILKIPKSRQHYWSPQLTLELEEIEKGTLIRGLFGPKPGVWTMFVFLYSAIGFLTLMGLMFGLSQMMLKMEAYAMWSVPVGLLLLATLFITSKVGQKLGRDQMEVLKKFVDDALQ
jgi:hypothetical protein